MKDFENEKVDYHFGTEGVTKMESTSNTGMLDFVRRVVREEVVERIA